METQNALYIAQSLDGVIAWLDSIPNPDDGTSYDLLNTSISI